MNKKKDAVVVIAIGSSKKWDICKKTVIRYCEKYNLPLEVITEKQYNIKKYENICNFNFFEKNQVYELFDKYNRILRLDWDLIINFNCPNLFDIVPENKIGVVCEDLGSRKKDRISRIETIQNKLGDLNWSEGYINTGVVLASKQHREIFHTSLEDIELVENLNLRVSKEQTFFNYLVRKYNFKIYDLKYKFNHTKMFSEAWNGYAHRYNSYIIHYAGIKKPLNIIKHDYNRIFLNRIGLRGYVKNFLRFTKTTFSKELLLLKDKSKKKFIFYHLLKVGYNLINQYIINIDYKPFFY